MIEEAKTIDYRTIPKLTGSGRYQVDIQWNYLDMAMEQYRLDMDADFQRGHVWTTSQRIAYVENRLRGETQSRNLQMNNPAIHGGDDAVTLLVDGKQRLTSVLMFIHDEIPAFGHLRSQFTNFPRLDKSTSFNFCIQDLKTRAEVLKWYVELNSGGVVHTEEEIDRVRALLEAERTNAEIRR